MDKEQKFREYVNKCAGNRSGVQPLGQGEGELCREAGQRMVKRLYDTLRKEAHFSCIMPQGEKERNKTRAEQSNYMRGRTEVKHGGKTAFFDKTFLHEPILAQKGKTCNG